MVLDALNPRRLLIRAAQRGADRTAVVDQDVRLSYGELSRRCRSLAGELRQAGIDTGVQVALALPNSLGFLVWYFAILEAGGVAVPLPTDLPEMGVAGRLETGEIPFLVVPERVAPSGLTPMFESGVVEGSRLWRKGGPIPKLAAEGILMRQYSSGSTGRPKELLKTEENIADDYQHFSLALGLHQDDVFLGVAPFCHSFGLLSLLAAFHVGGTLIVLPRFLSGGVFEALRRDSPTVFLATPPMIQILGECRLEPGDDSLFKGLRFCISSAASLTRAAFDAFKHRYGKPVHVQYGSTETLSTTVNLDEDYHEGYVGRPYPGVEVAIFDEAGGRCQPGQRGCVGICSPAASRSYVGDSLATAQTFREGFVFPGDTGFLDAQGGLHILGRSDVLNIGGYKVDCLEVEGAIRSSLPVSAVVVMAGQRAGLPVVRALVEADPNQVTGSMVRDACRNRLAPHNVPALVEVLASLPRDAHGKIQRTLI